MTTAIVSALPEELAPLRRRVEITGRLRLGRLRLARGRLAGGPVVLAVTGDGPRRAAEGLATLLDAVPARRVLVLGIAGGLSPELAVGDLVLGGRLLRAPELTAVPGADPAWLESARTLEGARPGVLLTVPAVVAGRRLKAELAARLARRGLGGEPAAMDLESAHYAVEAARRGLPLLVARAVSDTVAEDLPPFLVRCRRADGGTSRARVAAAALLAPASLATLLALRRRLLACARRLALFAERLLTCTAIS